VIRAGEQLRTFERALIETIRDAARVLDIGTSQRFAKELRPFEALFAGKQYVAAGYRPLRSFGQYNCDEHQDIQALTYPDGGFDAVLCIEVLEHVADPFKAVAEIKRVLRPGGRLLVTAPFLGPFHGKGGQTPGHEDYADYWRFTHQGLQLMFSDLSKVEVIPVDGPVEFRLRYLRLVNWVDRWPLRQLLDRFDKPRLGRSTTRHVVLGTK
jgi:SAM-dependent methyltransferase